MPYCTLQSYGARTGTRIHVSATRHSTRLTAKALKQGMQLPCHASRPLHVYGIKRVGFRPPSLLAPPAAPCIRHGRHATLHHCVLHSFAGSQYMTTAPVSRSTTQAHSWTSESAERLSHTGGAGEGSSEDSPHPAARSQHDTQHAHMHYTYMNTQAHTSTCTTNSDCTVALTALHNRPKPAAASIPLSSLPSTRRHY